MSIYHDLFMMAALDVKNRPESDWAKCRWAVRTPDRKPGYWDQRLQGKVLRRLRYQRMMRRRGSGAPTRVRIAYDATTGMKMSDTVSKSHGLVQHVYRRHLPALKETYR